MAEVVKIRTGDEQVSEVPKDVACQSLVVKAAVEDYGVDEEVPLLEVTKPVLDKVMEYCAHLKEVGTPPVLAKPLRGDSLGCDQWYADFINGLDEATVLEVILAANNINLQSLFELASARAALIVKDKSAADLRTFFKVQNDWTAADEERIRKENKWAEETV